MGKPIRRLIVAAGAALTIGTGTAVWVTSSAGAATAAAAAKTPACSAANLSVWLNTRGGAAAGTAGYALEFTNVSNRACHLSGYPGVSALNAHGKQLGNAASRDPRVKVTTVTIAAGGTAHADLGWTDVLLFPASQCKPTTATFIRAFPPGAKHSDLGFAPIQACSVKGESYLHVTAVTSGQNLS